VYVFVGPEVGVFVFVAARDVFVAPLPELVFVGVFVEVLTGVLVFVGGAAVFVGVFVRTGAPGTTRTEPQNCEVLLLKSVAVAKTWLNKSR
jgi:hypothetical protein